MLPFGMILAWAGYGLGSWGYILVKGYNITLREWFSPLHPYTGDLASAGTVPQGQIFPGAAGGGQGGGTSGTLAPQQQAGRQALQHRGRPPVQ